MTYQTSVLVVVWVVWRLFCDFEEDCVCLFLMAAVVRIKDNRYVRIDLQNKNAKYYSFKDITQPGVLHGYIKGVVKTAYPVFPQNYYGKLRKMILEETKDDEDDDGERLEFPILTIGTVAEGCAEVKEGDYLLLENPYFELPNPDMPNLQISGYKRWSDICIWNISNKGTLLVGPEEDGLSAEDIAKYQEDNDVDKLDDSEIDSSQNQSSSSDVKDDDTKLAKSDKTAKTDSSGSTDIAKSVRVTRSSTLKKDGQLQRVTRISSSSKENDRKVTRNTLPRRKDAGLEESSQESHDSSAFQSERRVTRSSLKKATDSKNERVTRSTSNKHNAGAKESSQESQDSSASQSEGPLTRSASSKTTDSSDTFSSPPCKRKRKFRLGPKGSSESPGNSPDLRNVVALEFKLVKTPVRKDTPQPEASNTRAGKKTPPVNSSDKIGESTRGSPCPGQPKVPSSSKSLKGVASADSSQENEDKEEGELVTNSQASTPSGTFSSKKQNCFGQRDSSLASPRKNLGPSSKNDVNTTPKKANKIQTSLMVGSPGKVKNTINNSTQPNTAKSAVVTFVDDNQVPETRSDPNSGQGKGAKGVVDESGMSTKKAAVAQPTVNGITTSSTTASSDMTISAPSSNGPSTCTTSTAATSTTSTGNVPPQPSSYTIPPPYTKICDVKLNTMCDLYGVAKFFKPPWKSKGTDMCSVVVIADPSTDEPLECVMFKDVILLPQVRRVGDIVRLHRMNIKTYKDKLQAVSTRGFSALVFDGNVNSPVTKESARVETQSFTFVDAEKKIVQDLKEWRLSRPDLFEEAKFLTVSMVEPDVYFDILCQVKGISKHTNVDCVVLRVTDGTKPKYEIKSCEDDDFYQVIVAADGQSQSLVFDVFLYGEHASLVNTLEVKAGTVLLLHNVHSIATQGGPGASLLDVLEPTLELCIHRGSEYGRGLAALPPESNEAVQLLQRLKLLGETSPRK